MLNEDFSEDDDSDENAKDDVCRDYYAALSRSKAIFDERRCPLRINAETYAQIVEVGIFLETGQLLSTVLALCVRLVMSSFAMITRRSDRQEIEEKC